MPIFYSFTEFIIINNFYVMMYTGFIGYTLFVSIKWSPVEPFDWFQSGKDYPPCSLYYGLLSTVRCRYNAVNFLKNINKRHPIARPSGRGMGCLLWIQHLIDILPQFLQLLMQYLIILNRVITALDCIRDLNPPYNIQSKHSLNGDTHYTKCTIWIFNIHDGLWAKHPIIECYITSN